MVSTTILVRQTAEGVLTIPAEFRRKLGIEGETMLRLTLDDGALRVEPIEDEVEAGGSSWFAAFHELFAPARQEADEKGYTDEEINEWIDEAVAAVRAERAARTNRA